jgi:glycine/D-amino acid oxidase-like deaminating enzyme
MRRGARGPSPLPIMPTPKHSYTSWKIRAGPVITGATAAISWRPAQRSSGQSSKARDCWPQRLRKTYFGGYQYWRQLPDGRLIVGGWRNHFPETEFHTYDETPYAGIHRHLDTFVHESLDLPDVKIARRWAGIMAFTPDNLPLVGQLPGVNNCYICGGYTGHGNAFAIICARLVSELALGKTNRDGELFEVGRFL